VKEDLKSVVAEALEQVAIALATEAPITQLERIKLCATLEYARRKLGEIQVLQRVRKQKQK